MRWLAGHAITTEEWLKSEECKTNADLRHALVTRPLTTDELSRVGSLGIRLLIEPNVPYSAAEKQQEFANMLAIQNLITVAAGR